MNAIFLIFSCLLSAFALAEGKNVIIFVNIFGFIFSLRFQELPLTKELSENTRSRQALSSRFHVLLIYCIVLSMMSYVLTLPPALSSHLVLVASNINVYNRIGAVTSTKFN